MTQKTVRFIYVIRVYPNDTIGLYEYSVLRNQYSVRWEPVVFPLPLSIFTAGIKHGGWGPLCVATIPVLSGRVHEYLSQVPTSI